MTTTDALFAAVIVLAGLTQTVAGFGFMLVATTLGALLVPVPQLVAIALPLSLLSASWVAFEQRRLIDLRVIFRVVVPAMLTGAVIGVGLSGTFPAPLMRRLLGGLVLSFVAMRVLRRGHEAPTWPVWLRTLIVVCAGAVQGLFGTGGPLLVVALEGMKLGVGPFRATLMGIWTIINTTLVTVMVLRGRYETALLSRLCVGAVAVVVGVWLGQRLHSRLSPARFQAAVYTMLGFAAIALLR